LNILQNYLTAVRGEWRMKFISNLSLIKSYLILHIQSYTSR